MRDATNPWEEEQGTCDCVPMMLSSKSCRKCGRRATITQQQFNDHMIDLAQYHYVLKQIADGEDQGQAREMAERVLGGERGVRARTE